MTLHIGIVAVSPEGGALCYRQIFRHASRYLPPHDHPLVSVHNLPLASYIDAVRREDWHQVAQMLRRSAEVLAGAGADFCLTPDHAVLHGVHLAEANSAVPWLNMTDLVAQAVDADGRHIVGVVGTKIVTGGSSYQTHLGLKGITVLPPDPDDAETLDNIVFGELIYGNIRLESQMTVLRIIEEMRDRGCEGVILGCSEGSLLVTTANSALPVYDAVDILAERAVRHAMQEEEAA